MKTDFRNAHDRHWKDAESLFSAGRYANADHLYGFCAECGLKSLMKAFGMLTSPEGNPTKADEKPSDRDDRVHADGIWIRYEAYRSTYSQGGRYPLPGSDPFGNWDVSQRYVDEVAFSEQHAEAHKQGALLIVNLLKQVELDGILL